MGKETFKKTQIGVSVLIGFVVSFSIISNSYEVAVIGVTAGILILIQSRNKLDEGLTDERNTVIQKKASTKTLSIVTVVLALSGLAMVEFGHRWFDGVQGYGYFMAYQAMAIQVINSVFMWYYGRQMGD